MLVVAVHLFLGLGLVDHTISVHTFQLGLGQLLYLKWLTSVTRTYNLTCSISTIFHKLLYSQFINSTMHADWHAQTFPELRYWAIRIHPYGGSLISIDGSIFEDIMRLWGYFYKKYNDVLRIQRRLINSSLAPRPLPCVQCVYWGVVMQYWAYVMVLNEGVEEILLVLWGKRLKINWYWRLFDT